jgi:hypothetical protein
MYMIKIRLVKKRINFDFFLINQEKTRFNLLTKYSLKNNKNI